MGVLNEKRCKKKGLLKILLLVTYSIYSIYSNTHTRRTCTNHPNRSQINHLNRNYINRPL